MVKFTLVSLVATRNDSKPLTKYLHNQERTKNLIALTLIFDFEQIMRFNIKGGIKKVN